MKANEIIKYDNIKKKDLTKKCKFGGMVTF